MSAVRRMFVVCLSLMFVLVVFVPVDSSAEDFKVVWTIQLPRETYFIGETVSLTVTAFASTDPTLKIPGEMALITIRNQSMVEVFSSWITTNSNGSSPIQYDIELTSDTGNYTVILDPLNGETAHESFNVLYNEETYWKERVDQLQEEIDRQYQYLNYLFAYDQWLTREIKFWKNLAKWSFGLTFIVLFVGLWVFFPELARRSRSEKGIYAQVSKGLTALGMGAEPRIYLEHEEVAQVEVPKDKAAPREHATNFCPVCDPDMKSPMTLVQLDDHIRMHDKVYMQRSAWRGKFRKARKDREANRKAPPEIPTVSLGTVKEYSDKWNAKQKKTELRIRLKVLKDLERKHKITPEKKTEELNKIKAEVAELKKKEQDKPEVPKPTSAKPLVTRKARMERRISPPIIEHPQTTNSKTPIDELFEKLSNEKVN